MAHKRASSNQPLFARHLRVLLERSSIAIKLSWQLFQSAGATDDSSSLQKKEIAMPLMLVVCTGNLCRSPMAEGLLKTHLAKAGLTQWRVESRGTGAVVGWPATAEAESAMAEFGLDISGHRARQLTGEDVEKAHLILCLTGQHLDYVFGLDPEAAEKTRMLTHWDRHAPDRDIADPYMQSYRVYLVCRDEILDSVWALVKHLSAQAGAASEAKSSLET